MNRIIAPNFGKQPSFRLRHVSRLLAATIGVFLLTAGSAQADPVQITRVAQTVKSLQGNTDIQLTLISQDPGKSGVKAPVSGPSTSGVTVGIGSGDPKLDALLGGFPTVADDLSIGVDDIGEDGEVDGTICDCGEIFIAGGGFPKWPLLFLTAVPLAFIPDCDDCDHVEPTPTPTPTPAPSPNQNIVPTPEPASLLLFGTGLVAASAGLRRRYRKSKLADQNQTEEDRKQ